MCFKIPLEKLKNALSEAVDCIRAQGALYTPQKRKTTNVNTRVKRILTLILLTMIGLWTSLVIHEIGHALAFLTLGQIPSFGVRPDALYVSGMMPDTIFGVIYVTAAGPLFSAVVFTILGSRRKEMFVAAVYQYIYTPFEVVSWLTHAPYGSELILMGVSWTMPIFAGLVIPVLERLLIKYHIIQPYWMEESVEWG